ncbi:MAG: HNH endonuclease [Gammaproteobacteria bacterium]
MPDVSDFPKELLERISAVTNKRARFVLDSIIKNGAVTTEEINQAGYDHPPRAAQDVRDLGFRLKTIKVKHTNGRSIAAYIFDEGELEAGKEGRRLLPKKERDALIHAAGDRCQICGAAHNLQVDHRIPYEVAGESQRGEESPYQILCGSCNRKKSWACEHCKNWLQIKSLDACLSCYWAEPTSYSHIAMQLQRRVDLVWIGDEVPDFERVRSEAEHHQRSVAEEIKQILKNTR